MAENNVNYYEILDISPSSSLDYIQTQLTRLEQIWRKREITTPEKATKMLATIIDARLVFHSEKTRQEYDNSLLQLGMKNESSSASSQDFEKNWNNAKLFHNDGQWDLALKSIEKVLAVIENIGIQEQTKLDVYVVATSIYFENKLFNQALDCANESIIMSPDNLTYYFNKDVVLRGFIDSCRKQSIDVSQLIVAYRANCDIWIKKAKSQTNSNSLADALYYYAAAFINYEPKDYSLAEKYTIEALTLVPEHDGAKKVLQFLNQPRQVSLNDLEKYSSEPCKLYSEITNMINHIVSSGSSSGNEEGWVLATKEFNGWYNPDKDGNDEEESRIYTFFLQYDGSFLKRTDENKLIIFKNGGSHQSSGSNSVKCTIDDVMLELDFGVYGDQANGNGWEERTTSAKEIKYFLWTYKNTRTINRLYQEKGKGLYNVLKKIVDTIPKKEKESTSISNLMNDITNIESPISGQGYNPNEKTVDTIPKKEKESTSMSNLINNITNIEFPFSGQGYNPNDVDTFLDELCSIIGSEQLDSSIIDRIVGAEFAISHKGYNQDSVDNFLDSVCDRIENIIEANKTQILQSMVSFGMTSNQSQMEEVDDTTGISNVINDISSIRFPTSKNGYDQEKVEDFLDHLCTILKTQKVDISIIDLIVDADFSSSPTGYDQEAVDNFFDSVCDTLENIVKESKNSITLNSNQVTSTDNLSRETSNSTKNESAVKEIRTLDFNAKKPPNDQALVDFEPKPIVWDSGRGLNLDIVMQQANGALFHGVCASTNGYFTAVIDTLPYEDKQFLNTQGQALKIICTTVAKCIHKEYDLIYEKNNRKIYYRGWLLERLYRDENHIDKIILDYCLSFDGNLYLIVSYRNDTLCLECINYSPIFLTKTHLNTFVSAIGGAIGTLDTVPLNPDDPMRNCHLYWEETTDDYYFNFPFEINFNGNSTNTPFDYLGGTYARLSRLLDASGVEELKTNYKKVYDILFPYH